MKTPITKDEFESRCYSAYCLDWMISHGFSLDDYRCALMNGVECYLEDEEISDTADLDTAMLQSMDVFENSQGFGSGSIYACFNEFLDAEFQDEDYMGHLISSMPNSEELMRFYCQAYGKMEPPAASVETPAGTIAVYKNPDLGQPGVCVMLRPKGTEDEIDLALVTSITEPGYVTKDNEAPEDVEVYTYGDPYTEDYTSKSVIKRGDVVQALEIDDAEKETQDEPTL